MSVNPQNPPKPKKLLERARDVLRLQHYRHAYNYAHAHRSYAANGRAEDQSESAQQHLRFPQQKNAPKEGR